MPTIAMPKITMQTISTISTITTIAILIIAIAITILFSTTLYQTYKTHKTKNISYPILTSMLIFSTGILLALLQKSYHKETLEQQLKLETVNYPLLLTMYFIVGTLYIIYIKRLYEEDEAIEKSLVEKGIIDITNVSTEENPKEPKK